MTSRFVKGLLIFGFVFAGPLSQAQSVRVVVKNPFSNVTAVETTLALQPLDSAGTVSLRAFQMWQSLGKLKYIGDAHGITSVDNVKSDLFIVSDREMKAYGWCFKVDDQVPSVYADEFVLERSHQLIEWYYGYAHYLNGQWIGMCLEDFGH